jgi:hypothetical protein
MSSRTWTPTALASKGASKYAALVWRCVEAQHRVSTNRLVDSLVEQDLLETMLEESKPPQPEETRGLDYLLATPFRYDPRRQGSRFRRYGQRPGVFYAAEQVETAICETAFYKFLFIADAPRAKLPANAIEHTLFSVSCASNTNADLTVPPLSENSAVWEALQDYDGCQRFADVAREAGVTIIRYTSVRDYRRRANVALLAASAFAHSSPIERQTWRFAIKPDLVQAICEFPRLRLEFPVKMFLDDTRLAPLGTQTE